MTYRAVIFDMDGVLADSEPLYFEAINALLGRYGTSITDEQHRQVMAGGPREAFGSILRLAGVESVVSVDAYLEAFEPVILEHLQRMMEPLPGARELIGRLRERGVPLGLASSSKVSWINATLGAISLAGAFDVVVSGTQVAHPKPAPDVYLRAAELLGAEPAQCIAIEDTPTGLRSVNAAGMFAVQVRSSSTAFEPQPHADLVLESLEDFDTSLLRYLDA